MADRSIKVTLRADVQDFKNQFDQASKAAEQVGRSTEDAARKSKGVFGELKRSAQDNRQAWTTAGTALTGFGAAILGVGAMAARTGIAYNQLQQRAGAALEVLMGSAEAASAQMAKLNAFADDSPFQREIFIEAQQQLIAFGIEADRVVPILSAVQDAVAATGGSNADIAELVNIIAKVGSTGKITAQNLNELGYRGVDAATIIGEQMGKTGEQIRSEITAGTLDADLAIQALTDGMSERFGGAAAGMKETFDGALDRLRAAWRDLSAELMAPLVSPDGGGFLVDLTNSAADALRAIQRLPEPLKLAAGGMAALTGAASLGAGAFLLLLPRALDTIDAFRVLAGTFPRVASGLTAVGTGAAKLGLLVGAAVSATVAIQKLTDAMRGIDRVEFDLGANELAAALRDAEQSGDAFTATMGDLYDSGVLNKQMFDDLGGSIQQVADINWFQDLIGPLAATGINEAKDRFEGLGEALSQLAQEDLPSAQSQFRAFYDEAVAGGASFEEVMQVMPAFRDALTGIALDAGLATDDATLLKLATGELTPVIDEATGAVVGFEEGMEGAAGATQDAAAAASDALSAIQELANEFLNARSAARDYEDAIASASEAAKENGKAWEDGSEAARGNAEAIDDLASSALANAAAMEENGEATGLFLRDARQEIIDTAVEMGATTEEAERYVDQLGLVPEEIDTIIDLDTEAAQAKWDAIYAELWPDGGHPPMVIDPEVDPEGKVPAFTGLVETIPPEKNTDVNANTDAAEDRVLGFGEVLEQNTEDQTTNVGADVEPAIWEVNRFNTAVDEAGGTVEINGDTYSADDALATLMDIINGSDGTVTIDGMTVPADQALDRIIGIIDSSDGTVTIEGDNSPANRETDRATSYADMARGTMSIFGDNNPANSATDAAKYRTDRTNGTMGIHGNNSGAMGSISRAVGRANSSRGSISVSASTANANSAINHAARTRYATIRVNYSGIRNNLMAGRAGGGWLNEGLNAGGWVPGPYPGPGVDNTIWPVRSGAAGGKSLDLQPLAGTEFVVNGRSARQWGPMLEAINSGMRPQEVAPVQSVPVYQQARPQDVSASVDSAAIASAVAGAMSSWQPVVNIGGRQFTGLMVEHQQRARTMGAR